MAKEIGSASGRSSHRLIGVWSIVCLCQICPLRGEVDPFLRPYVLALDDLGSDGDLLLTVPLRKWRIDDDTVIDVVLSHRQESLEYGEVRSGFDLLPFQTSVMPIGATAWAWLRPGGETVRFEAAQRGSSGGRAGSKAIERVFGKSAPGSWQVFARGKRRLTVSRSHNWQAVEDDGWMLFYEGGRLCALATPGGRHLAVASVGRRITRVVENGLIRVELEWSEAGRPTNLSIDGENLRFKASENGALLKVTADSGPILADFTYHENGLLASATKPLSAKRRHFSWRPVRDFARGDSPYRKPCALISAGEVRYGYGISRGVIRLSAESAAQGRKHLNIGMRYGKVQWISDDP